jgi:two-component system sensor histidine kinase DesK
VRRRLAWPGRGALDEGAPPAGASPADDPERVTADPDWHLTEEAPSWRQWLRPQPSRSRFWRVFFSGIWLIYLIQPVVNSWGHGHSALFTGGAIVIVLSFAAAYIAVVGWWDRSPRYSVPLVALLLAIAVLACFLYGAGASALWIYVSVAAGMALPAPPWGMRGVWFIAACYTLACYLTHQDLGDFLSELLPVVFGGLASLTFRARIQVTRELIRAREKVALLAASEERLRLARDMHDLTGQSLSTITLKSQLAAKLLGRLPDSPERDRARDEVLQVADVSRQALADIREAISGYRRPTLAVETITARSALEAAGIMAHDDSALTLRSGTFAPEAEAALAWCLREAVTNAVRHSGARNCWLALRASGEEVSLEVRDDGHGAGGSGPSFDGAGLHGMAERLSAVGGLLEIRPGAASGSGSGSDGGFCLVARVPARQATSVGP